MSRTADVTAVVQRLGSPTRGEVWAELPGLSRKQLHRALEQCQETGRITLRDGRFEENGRGPLTVTGRVEEALRRTGGVTILEISAALGITRPATMLALQNLRWKRHIPTIVYTRKLPGLPHRLFLSEGDADAWVTVTKRAREDAAQTVKRGCPAIRPAPAMKPVSTLASKPGCMPAPVTLPKLPPVQVSTNPDGVPVTKYPKPTWDARYQVDPATRVVGGFADAGIGRYDV